MAERLSYETPGTKSSIVDVPGNVVGRHRSGEQNHATNQDTKGVTQECIKYQSIEEHRQGKEGRCELTSTKVPTDNHWATAVYSAF